MIYIAGQTATFKDLRISFGQISAVFIFVLIAVSTFYAQTSIATQADEKTIIIGDAKDSDVFSFGKTVIVKEHAKGVLVFGGDVIVEGRVDGDVATIGGSIIQKETAFIGGDVISFGGVYRPESKNPLRNPGKETIMYAGYEEELRHLTQNPSQLFAPGLTWSFLTQRILLMLFWFVISLALTTIAPGAVSRAVARFQLSPLKVVAFGMVGLLVTTVGVMLSLSFLPSYVYAIVVMMSFLLLVVSFVFGRVALQVSVGKRLQKRFLPDSKHSETLALFIGTFVWTLLLSIPYFWTFALVLLTAASLGLVLTARSNNRWEKA
ncbi:MAG: polymer-forming cytoskeletal protein [Pyrinomonadaceae bacterium]|nr:polymer-forming cytoskeletal protein [Pyrinomonadaceae bacterium]